MSGSERLGGELPPEFSHPVIDRARPLRFRLNGRTITAFEGDTVLSALLANGIEGVGSFSGFPLALDEMSAPAIALAGNEGRPDLAMPMVLCPATDGASFVTLDPAPASRAPLFTRLLARRRNSLSLLYRPMPGGWIDRPATREITTDVAVIGGGVAGLSAALAAAKRGLRVSLIEKEPILGGLSVLFGKADGEPAPEEMIADLTTRIAETGLVTQLLGTLAFDIDGHTIEAIRVTRTGGLPQPERISVTARTVVLATGSSGRVPIFPGNRLPGVREAGFAWRMAARYNIWPGQSAVIHTATNEGYRLALLGAASGKAILRAADPRIDPQTRFIEFCKAYGYRLAWGTAITEATSRRGTLHISTADAETSAPSQEQMSCDGLILAGGWQPELDLWVRAGGTVAWEEATQRLVAQGTLEHVVLAGNAVGFASLAGCANHGRVAIEVALGGLERTVDDPRIDPTFETPAGPLMLAQPSRPDCAPAFTAPGSISTLRLPAARGLGRIMALASAKQPPFSGPLKVLDVVGDVVAGYLEPASVANVCAERCVLPRLIINQDPIHPASRHVQEGLPTYLESRFGSDQTQWALHPDHPRRFEPGCLIFTNTDHRSPLQAIGVVLSGENGSVTALLAPNRLSMGETVYIRDGSAVVPARLDRAL